jgi:hypothetical protein
MTQAFNLSQFANKVNTSGEASLTTAVTGTLPVANGGTGAATLTSNNVLLGNGTSALQVVAPGSNGNVLTSNGTTWTSATPAGGGVTSLNGQTGAITNTDYGVIGSYVIAAENDYTANLERLPDVTVAGNTLIRSTVSTDAPINARGAANISVGSVPQTSLSFSGTWRRLTRSYNSNSGSLSSMNLYVRIS